MKRIGKGSVKRIVAALVCFAAVLTLGSCAETSGGDGDADCMTVTALKVGKADAIIIQCDGKTMVLDTGEDDDGEEIIEFLEESGTAAIDCMIITHFDKDHVGGADQVIEALDVGEIYVPAYTGEDTEYDEFASAMADKGIAARDVSEKVELTLGGASVTVDPPASYEVAPDAVDYDNDLSLIVTITHAGNRMIFMGDAESARTREWLASGAATECDVLKMPHHGDYNASTDELLDACRPNCAIICDSQKNPAESGLLDALDERGISVYETANGDITVISDSSGVKIGYDVESAN